MKQKKLLHTGYVLLIGICISIFSTGNTVSAEENDSVSFFVGSSVATFKETLETFKEKPLFIQNENNDLYEVPFEELIKMITYKEVQGARVSGVFVPITTTPQSTDTLLTFTEVTLDTTTPLLTQLVEENIETFERDVEDMIVEKTDTEFYKIHGEMQNGYSVLHDEFVSLFKKIYNNPEIHIRAIKAPISYKYATVKLKEGENYEVLDIVTEGVSDFSGSSSSRIHNINTARKRFAGLVVQPDEVFSFNKYLGEVDGSTGYKKELVIKGPKTIPEYGGGVCQVSTTYYRAALQAGFPIVERKPHSYAVSYYTPWGTDATIYPGIVDLKFKNDSDHPIVMNSFIIGRQLHVQFYGKKDGRSVELAGPNIYGRQGIPEPTIELSTDIAPGKKIVKENGHAGFSSWWSRKITTAEGELISETINSVYEARPAYIIEGTSPEAEQETLDHSTEVTLQP